MVTVQSIVLDFQSQAASLAEAPKEQTNKKQTNKIFFITKNLRLI
jgi:hypothetical protein